MASSSGKHYKLVSNFKEAEKAGQEAVQELLEHAGGKMADVAAERLDKAAGQRGYNLYSTDLHLNRTPFSRELTYGEWYGHFFEYGTATIQAMPFMRPGYNAGRRIIRAQQGAVFDRWFRRAEVRGF